MLLIDDAFLAGECSVEEVARTDLNTGLVGVNLEADAGGRTVEACCQLLVVTLAVFVRCQAPVVIETVGVLDGLIVEVVNVLAYGSGLEWAP